MPVALGVRENNTTRRSCGPPGVAVNLVVRNRGVIAFVAEDSAARAMMYCVHVNVYIS